MTERAGGRLQWALIAPALIFLGALFLYPLFTTLVDALWQRGAGGEIPALSSIRDERFARAAGRTVLLTAVAAPIEVLAGSVLGIACGTLYRGRGRLFLLFGIGLPVCLPPIAVGLAWRLFLDPLRSPIAHYWRLVSGSDLDIWSHAAFALCGIAVVDFWQWTGFVAIVSASVAATLPSGLIEQARLDGLSWGRIVRSVQFPYVRSAVIFVGLLRVVDLLRSFDLVYILTQGGPGTATETISFLAFESAFIHMRQTTAAAQAIWLFGLSTAVLLFGLRLVRREL